MTKEISKVFENKVVLFAPLNWGLGHATRCLPLIKLALNCATNVIIASDGHALDLLKEYFGGLVSYELPSYNIEYKYESMLLNGIRQGPKVWRAVQMEYRVIETIVSKENVQVIVSDNRFGCYNSKCLNVFITHQLDIQFNNPIIKRILNFQNQKWINKFNEIWIPDYKDSRLSGALSKAIIKNIPTYFIGPQTIHIATYTEKEWDILMLLSGPEPQRTYLENALLEQFSSLEKYRILLVGGSKNMKLPHGLVQQHIAKPMLIGSELTDALNKSRLIISRSGYSTVMDIDSVGLGAIFIPTPGQTEQEYLAKMLSKQSSVYSNLSQSEIKQKLVLMIKSRF